jgi:hypothetical protein
LHPEDTGSQLICLTTVRLVIELHLFGDRQEREAAGAKLGFIVTIKDV